MGQPDFSDITMYSYELAQAFHYATAKEVFALRVAAWALPKHPRIINIGAGSGTSGLSFAESRRDATIWTIDISAGGPLGGLENERNAFANKERLTLPIQMLGDSKSIGATWAYEPVDLVYIDGDHSYEGCLGDILNWRDHLKVGGLIAIHDYGRDEWPEVKRVVDESGALNNFTTLFVIDTLWVGRKEK
jgi:predicted O-methyltransferase YrrM